MRAKYDIVGIGNAIVDLITAVEPGFLDRYGMQPGSMALIDAATASALAAAIPLSKQSSGGSVANTCAVAACLGARVGFLGKVADDAWGASFRSDIVAAGVYFPTAALNAGTPTACCLILVTPDGQRTMNTYLGACVRFGVDDLDSELIAAAQITYLEGYLFDPPSAQASFHAAAAAAHAAGRKVALSLSDAFCVDRHRASFLKLLPSVDILLANESEVCSLYQVASFDTAVDLVRRDVSIAALTRGAAGSLLLQDAQTIEIAPLTTTVLDTTGAGDCYAAGFLSAFSRGASLQECGALGTRAATACIAVYGARPEQTILAAFAGVR